MPNKFEKQAADAAVTADKQFASEFSRLTKLNDSEIEKIIDDTGISKKDLLNVLTEVKSATASNEAKAKSIQKIDKGVSALVAIARTLL